MTERLSSQPSSAPKQKEDINTRAYKTLEKVARIRTNIENFLKRYPHQEKLFTRKRKKLIMIQRYLEKAIERAKSQKTKVPSRIIRRVNRNLLRQVDLKTPLSSVRIAMQSQFNKLKKIIGDPTGPVSPANLISLYTMMGKNRRTKFYIHKGKVRSSEYANDVKNKDGGTYVVIDKKGDKLKLRYTTYEVIWNKIHGAQGNKFRKYKSERRNSTRSVEVQFKIIDGKWVMLGEDGKVFKNEKSGHRALFEDAIPMIRGQRTPTAVHRGPRAETASKATPETSEPEIYVPKIPEKRVSEKLSTIQLPNAPEIKINGVSLSPKKYADIVILRNKIRGLLTKKKETSRSEIKRNLNKLLRRLPERTQLLDISGGIFCRKAFTFLVTSIYGGDATKMLDKIPKPKMGRNVAQPKNALVTPEVSRYRKVLITNLRDKNASNLDIRNAFELMLGSLRAGTSIQELKANVLRQRTYKLILSKVYGGDAEEIKGKLPISDKERLQRILEQNPVPQKAKKVLKNNKEQVELQINIVKLIHEIERSKDTFGHKIMAERANDPEWKKMDAFKRGKVAFKLMKEFIQKLKKMNSNLENGGKITAKQYKTMLSKLFKPNGKKFNKYFAKINPPREIQKPTKRDESIAIAALMKLSPKPAKKAKAMPKQEAEMLASLLAPSNQKPKQA